MFVCLVFFVFCCFFVHHSEVQNVTSIAFLVCLSVCGMHWILCIWQLIWISLYFSV